jgi:hypothetical protein
MAYEIDALAAFDDKLMTVLLWQLLSVVYRLAPQLAVH